ncbi:MAG: hypothetical protein FJZ13_01280 [Candidatus Omnitrophica bacterium]|nr:hypothetical protein [Candidatus Omnitrophota bacterium]
MGKKEYPKIKEDISSPAYGLSSPLPGFSRKVFSIVQLVIGIVLLPFIYTTTVAFIHEFSLIEEPLRNYFWAGLISFLVIYLFVWEPAIIYAKGQRLLALVFTFIKPMVKVAPFLLPVYTIILFILFGLASLLFKSAAVANYFVFSFGFSMGLHLVFSAKSIRSKQGDFLRANYIFGFSFIYILNIFLLIFCLNLFFEKISFVNFVNNSFQAAKDIFSAVFRQLFL